MAPTTHTRTPQSGDGADWWTIGAQGGVSQPPYVVRWRGRWYRTLHLKAAGDPARTILADTLAWVRALPHLERGARRCMDYLTRTGKHFDDLPLLLIPPPSRPSRRIAAVNERAALLAERDRLRDALVNLTVACANVRNSEAQLAALADARAALAAREEKP